MKVFFNTKAFEGKYPLKLFDVAGSPAEAQIAVLGAKKINLADFPRLKAIYRFGVGTENVPFDELKSRNIAVFFPGDKAKRILYESTANFTLYLIFRMIFDEALGDVENWKKGCCRFIGDKTLLVIGTGHVGSRVANKAKVFMDVLTFDIATDRPEILDDHIKNADVISLHIPGSKDNEAFFDRRKLDMMKNGAILINTARGVIVDEDALYDKLKNSDCRAAFDAFWKEPYVGKLKEFDDSKFFMTPHVASQTREYIEAGFEDMLSIIKGYSNE